MALNDAAPPRNVAVAVGTSSVEIAEPKPERYSIYIRNTSSGAAAAAKITIVFSNEQAAVANAGAVLGPGEYLIESTTESYPAWKGRISAISDTAASQVSIIERS